MNTSPPTFSESMLPANIGAHTRDSLALTIWREQLARGLGQPGEVADDACVSDWLANRTYAPRLLDDAIAGDVAALAEIRAEAGLPILT